MPALNADPTFQAYIASTIVLGLNLLVLANNTALSRARASEVINPEDKRLNAGANVVYNEGNDRTQRYQRAHRNALENIPLFLISGFLLVLVGASSVMATSLFAAFVATRLVHSVAYVGQYQPWRTASFGLGAIVQLVLLGYLGYCVFL